MSNARVHVTDEDEDEEESPSGAGRRKTSGGENAYESPPESDEALAVDVARAATPFVRDQF